MLKSCKVYQVLFDIMVTNAHALRQQLFQEKFFPSLVVLDLGSMELQGFSEAIFQGLGGSVHPTPIISDVTLCLASLCTSTVYSYIHVLCIRQKSTFYLSNYEGLMDCRYMTRAALYLQQGQQSLICINRCQITKHYENQRSYSIAGKNRNEVYGTS